MRMQSTELGCPGVREVERSPAPLHVKSVVAELVVSTSQVEDWGPDVPDPQTATNSLFQEVGKVQ